MCTINKNKDLIQEAEGKWLASSLQILLSEIKLAKVWCRFTLLIYTFDNSSKSHLRDFCFLIFFWKLFSKESLTFSEIQNHCTHQWSGFCTTKIVEVLYKLSVTIQSPWHILDFHLSSFRQWQYWFPTIFLNAYLMAAGQVCF